MIERPESQIQSAFIREWSAVGPDDVQVFHIPNGENRTARTGRKLKNMGVVRGIFDIGVVLPDGSAAFIEFKRPGEKIAPGSEQDRFRDWCEARGVPVAVCTHEADAVSILFEWARQARMEAA